MLKRLEIVGFKSFAKKTVLDFSNSTTAIVGPNGSGKSNVAEAFRFALGEQSMKSMRGKRAEDLIFNGSHTAPRANRASVAIIFDNSRRTFKIDFDEVSLERAVFRDGTSEYSINGSKVRLRDITELLAGANIGETGHHIISQGESDRILLANNRERRAMLEDALGLKIYEFKKNEAQKKLIKTEENIAQVNSLRRELAPHLHFLENQVKKLDRANLLRDELVNAAQTYFSIEDAYLAQEKLRVVGEKRDATERLVAATAELHKIEELSTTDAEGMKRLELVRKIEKDVERLNVDRSALSRAIGRVEGSLAVAKEHREKVVQEPYVKVPREDLATLAREVEDHVAEESRTPDALYAALVTVGKTIKAFMSKYSTPENDMLGEEESTAYALENERAELLSKDSRLAEELERTKSALARAREALTAHEEGVVARSEAREYELTLLFEMLERDKSEVLALAGMASVSYSPLSAPPIEERRAQEDRRRTMERTKIRLEEDGGTGEDIRKEHKDVSEREAFLAKELDDLAKSASGLGALISDLDTELAKHFSEGLAKVNASFGEYFALMFGGGSARLTLEEPEELEAGELDGLEEKEEELQKEPERPGIEIAVNLPKKKVRSLMQLSGGERALTSIALIFAMSQVNPPPFLILDETDAAPEEANRRRYGDMIENLAKKAQLFGIPPNRETMSRTNI